MERILDKLNTSFPKLNRISAYALPSDLLSKTESELKTLVEKGLKLLYVGIESGDDELLGVINKNETFNSTSEALIKARNAGFKLSVMILNGLGGKQYSHQHAINSAKIINKIQPEYLSTLVLSFPFGAEHYKNKFNLYSKDFIRNEAINAKDGTEVKKVTEMILFQNNFTNRVEV